MRFGPEPLAPLQVVCEFDAISYKEHQNALRYSLPNAVNAMTVYFTYIH